MIRCSVLFFLCLAVPLVAAEPAAKPLRIAHLSDIHACHVAQNPPGRFPGDPLARDLVRSRELLHKAVARINAIRPDVAVITGDLADRGDDLASLREVKAELDRLVCPYCPVIGDHDRPETFQQVFPGKLNYTFDIGQWRLVALELRRGQIHQESLAWLAGVLAKSQGRRVAILTHRPLYCDPLTTQLATKLYSVKLTPGNAAETLDLLGKHAEVQLVLSGHAHVARRDKRGAIEMLWAPALVGPPYCFGLITLDGPHIDCRMLPAEGRFAETPFTPQPPKP
jgi:3',5'-cyclic AMP phosphodiesterase CpdA